MFLHDMLDRATRLWGNAPALADGAVRLTYRELDDRVHRLAAALQGLGLVHGDHIAVLSLNGFRYMEVYLAAALGGFVVAPVNTRLHPLEVEFILNDGEIKALLLGPAFVPVLQQIKGNLKRIRHFVLMAGEAAPDLFTYEQLLADADPTRLEQRPWREEDLVHLCYTGGTTGLPKGVMLSQRNVVANVHHAIQMAGFNERDVWLHAAPMFHLADSWACFALTLLGAFHVFMEAFQPAQALELIQRHRVTASLWVPTMINSVLALPEARTFDLSSMRRLVYGASPMPPERLKEAIALFGDILLQAYGQTESAPFLTCTTLRATRPGGDARDIRRLASCGQEIVGVEVRVVDDADRPVRPGEVGEIVARGANVMLGYWKRPEETAAALRNGWLHTGDLATIDEENHIYIVDRAKDMIITGGENVYSTEVENALYRHPAVLEAAVIGVPDDRWGEAVKAVVVLREGSAANADALIVHCHTLIAGYKCPKTVDFADALPKSGAGKILKSQLRDPYWEGEERGVH